jgi:predicted dehydrogenase
MSEIDNEKLKIAFCGLNNKGLQLLEVVDGLTDCEIVAVFGSDKELAVRIGERYSCLAFDDLRQLVLNAGAQLLVLAANLQTSPDILNVAIQNGVHLLKVPPAAIDFATCMELINSAAKHKVSFMTANICRFAPGFSALERHLLDNPQDAENTYLIEAVGKFSTDTSLAENRWLSDPELAGGGVLLRDCYNLIQEIIINFSLPESVYTLKTNLAPDKTQRLSLTEDCSVVSMRFSDKLMGSLIANRTCHKNEQFIRLYCPDKYISARPGSLKITDLDGNLISEAVGDSSTEHIYRKIFADITQQIRDEQYNATLANEQQTLMTMAFIEACYLSSKTAMPETPDKLLAINNAENPAVIWNKS